jgi:CRISPR-associated protein Cmr3
MNYGIELTPVDTLFFRGAEPMEAGESHHLSTLFPPMPSTLLGALRTAMMVKHSIAFRDYLRGEYEADMLVKQLLGEPNQAGFAVCGVLFVVSDAKGNSQVLFPVPAHWYADSNELEASTQRCAPLTLREALPLPAAAARLGIVTHLDGPLRWVTPGQTAAVKPLAGMWMTKSVSSGSGQATVVSEAKSLLSGQAALLPPSALFEREVRTGIARDNQLRAVVEGHLFTAPHIRLKPGVSLLALVDQDLNSALGETGILQLGGEQRVASFRLQESPLATSSPSSTWVTLAPLSAQRRHELEAAALATSGLQRVGGWEMKAGGGTSGKNQGFHRDMVGWYPAGTTLFFESPKPVAPGFLGL